MASYVLLVEACRRQLALELVEEDVEELERHHLETDVGEDARRRRSGCCSRPTRRGCMVRRDMHALGDDAAEAVGVDVEALPLGSEYKALRPMVFLGSATDRSFANEGLSSFVLHSTCFVVRQPS